MTRLVQLLILALIAVSPLPGPQPGIVVTAHVADATGRVPQDLQAADFAVTIGGHPAAIEVIRPAQPFSALLLLDVSASMTLMIDRIAGVPAAIAASLGAGSVLRVAAVTDRLEIGPEVGRDGAAATAFVRAQALGPTRPTALWDAINTALVDVERQPRAALIVVSDGDDTVSRSHAGDASRRAQRAGIQIHGIEVAGMRPAQARPPGPEFRDLARDTAGSYVQLKTAVNVAVAVANAVIDLRDQIELQIDPKSVTGGSRDVKVQVKRPSLTIRAAKTIK